MADIEKQGLREQQLLRTSVVMLLCLSVGSFGFGILTGSFAILFDGFYGLIDACMSGLAMIVSRLITRNALRRNQSQSGKVRYQYGFWHLEPLVLALNGIMLTLIILYALAGAIIVLFDGGSEPDFGGAVIYSAISLIVCLIMTATQTRRNRTLGSRFVALDTKGWRMSGAISFALLAAFLVGWFLTGTKFEFLQPYVDPVILTVVCLAVIPLPFSDLRAAFRDIFMVAPEELDLKVRESAVRIVAQYRMEDCYTYVARIGRSVMIEIHFVVPQGWQISSIAQLDAIRQEVGSLIGGEGPHRWLTISFTEDADWAF